jgi:hypothetical protein
MSDGVEQLPLGLGLDLSTRFEDFVPGPDNAFTLHPGTWRTAFRVSAALLQNIFTPYSLLHDGAAVIRGDEIVAHYTALADVGLPVVAYNAPRYSNPITPGIADALADLDHVVGIKDSSGDLQLIAAYLAFGT